MLDFLKNFDWISPIRAVGNDIAHGGGHTFIIPQSCGWTGREINKVLKRAGCETWGLMAINDVFTVTVPRNQAKQGEQALDAAGIPTGEAVEQKQERHSAVESEGDGSLMPSVWPW